MLRKVLEPDLCTRSTRHTKKLTYHEKYFVLTKTTIHNQYYIYILIISILYYTLKWFYVDKCFKRRICGLEGT